MSYRVLFAQQFQKQLNELLDHFEQEDAPRERVSAWLNEIMLLLDGLEESPLRFPVATDESDIAGIALRRVVFGRYLIFYHVEETRQEVQIYGFRHGCAADLARVRRPHNACLRIPVRQYRKIDTAPTTTANGLRSMISVNGRHSRYMEKAAAALRPTSAGVPRR